MTAAKAELRELVRRLEREMSPAHKAESDRALRERFLALPAFRRATTVFFYLGVGPEIDTRPLIEAALEARKTAALPRIAGPGLMEARKITALSELVPGRFRIPEPPANSELVPPELFDLILVPGAAFSPEGGRLGRGGGYYDRYLPQTRGVKLALVRSEFLFHTVPVEEHDVPVDVLLTETGPL